MSARKDGDELKHVVDSTVEKFLGTSEPTLVKAAISCLDKGYDKKKTVEKLLDVLDDYTAASKFVEKLFTAYDDFKSRTSRKRKDENGSDGSKARKVKRFEEAELDDFDVPTEQLTTPSPGQLTAEKIKEMMANAQKMIQERKAQLTYMTPPTASASAAATPTVPPATKPAVVAPLPQPAATTQNRVAALNNETDKARRAMELQAKIQAQLAAAGLQSSTIMNVASNFQNPSLAMRQQQQPQGGPTPLILDELGRTIDAKTGMTIQLQQHQPTLKANIRAMKREQFKAVISEKPPDDTQDAKFFDPRVSLKAGQRLTRRAFKFHDKGKYVTIAQRLRTKAQLDKLQNEISQAAKKTGIASAVKLAVLQAKELRDDHVPDIEWWDSVILRNETYDSLEAAESIEGVTNLVEHPIQMKPPTEQKQVVVPVILTAKERKKMRRQRRAEALKDQQEKIRLGLAPPAEPKVRLANLMRVLGTEAVQDPTKVEAHVRAQMAKRIKDHETRNATRQLTDEQRREKKIRKLQEDTTQGVHVSVYRVKDLSGPSAKFKVETNAKQLFMTGVVVLHKDCNIVVVEGGPKQQKKFRRLMLNRIKWEDSVKQKNKRTAEGGAEASRKREVNTCSLVWEGTVLTRSFNEVQFKSCPTEAFAREQFRKHGVEHYWDLAFSKAVLEASGEDV